MEKEIINPDVAIVMIKSGQPISDKNLEGKFELNSLEVDYEIHQQIIIEDSIIDEIYSYGSTFLKKVIIKNSVFKNIAMFQSAYFNGGLEIENCVFEDFVDFSCSGHNFDGNEIKLEKNIFKKFVDFDDSVYEGSFILKSNTFDEGTNLLGNWQLKPIFGVKPVIEDNTGKLDLIAIPEQYYYKDFEESEETNKKTFEAELETVNATTAINDFLKFIDTLIPEDKLMFIEEQLNKLTELYKKNEDKDIKRFIDVLEIMKDANSH